MSVAYILDAQYNKITNSRMPNDVSVQSITADKHVVGDIELTKNSVTGALSVPAYLETTQLNAPIGLIDSVVVQEILPKVSEGDITVNGGLDLTNHNINNVSSITLSSGEGVSGQVLGLDDDLKLIWKTDSEGSVPTLYDVLNVGAEAGTSINMNNNYIENVSVLAGSNVELFQPEDGKYASLTIKDKSGTQTIALNEDGNIDCNIITGAYGNGLTLRTYGGSRISAQAELQMNDNMITSASNVHTSILSSDVIQSRTAGVAVAFQNNVNMNNNSLSGAYAVSALNVSASTMKASYLDTLAPEDDAIVLNKNLDVSNKNLVNVNTISSSQANVIINCGAIISEGIDVGANALVSGIIKANYDNASESYLTTIEQGVISCASLRPTFKVQYDYYVSPNGNDFVANGSIESPFKTIQACINACELLTANDNIYRYVHVLGGDYSTESLVIKKKIQIIGNAGSNDACGVGCQIGNVSIEIDANGNDVFNNAVVLQGLQINGLVEAGANATNSFVLHINDCYLYKSSGNGRMLYVHPSASDCRVWLNKTRIYNASVDAIYPVVEMSKGMFKSTLSEFLAAGNSSVLTFSGTARCDSITLSTFSNSSSLEAVPALVELNSSTGSAFVFGNCSFVYSNTASKINSINSCAIKTTSRAFVILLFNYFGLSGTRNYSNGSGNYVLRDPNASNPYTRSNVLFFSNSSGYDISVGAQGLVYESQASTIEGTMGVNKRTLNAVA